MALIPCPRCGNQISDKAAKCPHCGFKPSTEKTKMTLHDDTCNQEPHKSSNTQNKLLLIFLSVITIAIICAGVWLGIDYKQKKDVEAENLRLEQLRREQIRQDSIIAARKEAARQDSIRQDSIARRNFTSPDLALNELHGHVKRCVWSRVSDWDYQTVFSYTYDGVLVNSKGEFYHKYTRNKQGQIISDQEEFCETAYKWFKNRVSSSQMVWCEYETAYGDGATHYFYDNDGILVYTTTDGGDGENGLMRNMKTVFSDYKFDEMGNWISRKGTTTYQDDEFRVGNWKNHKEVHKEMRVITYFESNTGNDKQGHTSKPKKQKVNGHQPVTENKKPKAKPKQEELPKAEVSVAEKGER